MHIFSNISTRAKLLFGFGTMFTMLVAVSLFAYRNLQQLTVSQQALFKDDFLVASNLMMLRNGVNRERIALLSLALDDGAGQSALRRQLEQESADSAALITKILETGASDPDARLTLDRLAQARKDYVAVREHAVAPALQSRKRAQAVDAILGPLNEKFEVIRRIANEAIDHELAHARQRMAQADALVSNARIALALSNAAAVLLGSLLIFWLDRMIAAPLKQATGIAQRIAAGDLTVSVPAASGKDEVAQLSRALNAMVHAWRQSMEETNSAIAKLSAAASEILAGTTQVSAGASETAAAVSETTATVEEVKQTAVLASQKARTVSDAAQKAAQTADGGRAAIEDSIVGMDHIQEQMGSIAETIVRLSERSQAIAEITTSVRGLAEQSNLLAVNAAIEAAKAGEHGRGFAVVAQEVKMLADQSKQATKQVHSILDEIQKAVSAAVMTTEQGSRTVASGVQRTTEAGHAIRILSDNIADAAQMAAQIAATSQQQLAGMDQIAVAMENIKHVSMEHVAGSRQSEASARHLDELGRTLRQMSARFKL